MLARYARRLLLLELILLALAAAAMHAAGLRWITAIACALGISAAVRAGIMSSGFVLGSALRPAGGPPLSLAARARLLASELTSTTLAYSLLLPFPFLAGSAEPQSPNAGAAPPVLLVHGYICNRGIWRAMKRFLASQGIAAWTIDLEPVYASIEDYVPAIARRIDEILAASGAPQVVVVAHSMGGLAMRAYLRRHGGARVARLITLGTPHHGTRIAHLGRGENARQMLPGSAWLDDLARSEAAGPQAGPQTGLQAAPVSAIWSWNDNIISPQESARLPGAEDMPLEAVGHVALVFDSSVQERVLREIRRTRTA